MVLKDLLALAEITLQLHQRDSQKEWRDRANYMLQSASWIFKNKRYFHFESKTIQGNRFVF